MKIYFDDVLVDENYYMSYDEDYKMFEDSFYLGSTASVVAKLQVPIEAWNDNVSKVQIFINESLTNTFLVDKAEIQDDDTVIITLCDALMLLDKPCDFSSEIDSELGITAKQLLVYMCGYFNIQYVDFNFTNQDVAIHSYDSRLTARKYLSMIAELAGCFARINNEGYLEFVDFELSQDSFSYNDVDSFKLSEINTIGRVVYDNGVTEPKKSSDDTSLYTVYLDINNMFLQVITDAQFEAICDKIIGYQFANIKIETTNQFFKPGQTVSFIKDDNVAVPVICSYNKGYFGGFVGSYETNINLQERTETNVIPSEDKTRRLETIIDQINNELIIKATQIAALQAETAQLIVGLDNIQNLFQITGGSNLIKNSQFLLADPYWTFVFSDQDPLAYHTNLGEGYNSSLIGTTVSVANIILRNCKTITTNNNIINLKTNTIHTLNFYLSQDPNVTTHITLKEINNNETLIDETYTTTTTSKNMEQCSFSFTPNYSDYILTIDSSTILNGYTNIYDLMLNVGDIQSWEPAASEIYSTILKMSRLGMQVYSSGSNILTLITSDGFQIREARASGDSDIVIGRIISEFDSNGITTETIKSTKSIIGKYVQTELTINSYLHFVEYFQE